MKIQTKTQIRKHSVLGPTLLVLFAMGLLFVDVAYAADQTIGSLASNVTASLSNLAKLITAGAYVAGFGFAIGAILKFKAHKDNPTQIPVGTPIALIFIAAALIFLPSIFGVAGQTLFGSTSGQGGVSGVSKFS